MVSKIRLVAIATAKKYDFSGFFSEARYCLPES